MNGAHLLAHLMGIVSMWGVLYGVNKIYFNDSWLYILMTAVHLYNLRGAINTMKIANQPEE